MTHPWAGVPIGGLARRRGDPGKTGKIREFWQEIGGWGVRQIVTLTYCNNKHLLGVLQYNVHANPHLICYRASGCSLDSSNSQGSEDLEIWHLPTPSAGIAICTTHSIISEKRCPMTAKAERKENPISMRLPESDIAMIDRAAGLRGRSRTEFMREAAVRAAEEVLLENPLIRMSPKGFAEFLKLLSMPAAPVPEMVELAKRPAPWEPGYVAKR